MILEMDGTRRLLGHLPPWRHPDVHAAWTAHEESAPGVESVVGYTVDELVDRIAGHDPHVTFDVDADAIAGLLDDLQAGGYATVTDAGAWAQSEEGTDLLTGGHAEAHSQRVADEIAEGDTDA